jgi:hypothetical protein
MASASTIELCVTETGVAADPVSLFGDLVDLARMGVRVQRSSTEGERGEMGVGDEVIRLVIDDAGSAAAVAAVYALASSLVHRIKHRPRTSVRVQMGEHALVEVDAETARSLNDQELTALVERVAAAMAAAQAASVQERDAQAGWGSQP